MDSFFKKAQQALEQVVDSQSSGGDRNQGQSGGSSIRLPGPVVDWIEKYVDTFAPAISRQVSDEISTFQDATLQSLEDHIKAVFQAVFRGDFSAFQNASNIGEFRAARERSQDTTANQQQAQYGAGLPDFNYPTTQQRSGQEPLPEYGTRGLPFAGKLGNALGTQLALFNPQGETAPQHERNVFQVALNKVTDFAKSADDGIGGKLASVARTIDELNLDPLEKAKQVTPEIRQKVAKVLTDLHAPLADKLTLLALTQVKNFLKGSITTKEIGQGAVESVGGLVRGFMKTGDSNTTSRSAPGGGSNPVPDAPGGFVGLLSEKLSDGLTVIRAHTRQDFRKVLGDIEEKLFESLPSEVSGPLMAVLGGNPFSDDQQQQQARGGSGFNILEEVKDKLRVIIERIQKGLRDRVLEVVSGGHRKLEDKAWGNVQDAVVTKVQKFVPGIQVKLDD
ncbi:unnamed protein product [Rhizoctonia solani]|uniref:Uncharacterized protein n=1 Tax=Rhizoctonia solani TaxID=456999 RepID=A0A8H3ECM9_9AGAM|nr:unnamed protein product [Rhizoctonia solani]CAE7233752.1 unnamed protein product [Rhizoctonia solani]